VSKKKLWHIDKTRTDEFVLVSKFIPCYQTAFKNIYYTNIFMMNVYGEEALMIQLNRSVGIILVLIVGFLVQLIFSLADVKDTPNKAVVEFSKAYFQLDRSMAERICKEQLANDDVDIVDQYLYLTAIEASERGFDINFMKNKLYHIETETLSKNDTDCRGTI
jgi:hypothetical protein